MKKILCFLTLVLFDAFVLFGQTKTGTLKIFTEVNGIVLYLNDIKQDEGTKVVNDVPVGSHYLKALSNGTAIYGEIIEIKSGEVTTVLIKSIGNKVSEKPVVKLVENTGVVTYNPNPTQMPSPTDETDSYVSKEKPESVPLVNIGQVNGKLSKDIEGIFGLTWGMNQNDVNSLMTEQGCIVQVQGRGFSTFVMDGNTQKPFLIEGRFIDNKLFNIIVGYISIDMVQQKVNKLTIPISDYNEINETLLQTYGQPTKIQRDFTGGYKDGDGKEVEAIKKHQATLITTWTVSNGNVASLRIVYTKAMVVGVSYEYAPLMKDAHDRKLKLNSYQY